MKTEKNFYYYSTVILTLVLVFVVGFSIYGINTVKALYYPNPNYELSDLGPMQARCADDYKSWPKSDKLKKDVPWSNAFMITNIQQGYSNTNGSNMSGEMPKEYIMDLNGDGLVDYLYSAHSVYEWYDNIDCIYLHNGINWDPVYRCVGKREYYTQYKYNYVLYGDCADVENSTLEE